MIYILAAGVWILFSDELVGYLVSNPDMRVQLSILKGWGFVLLTGGLLYGVLRRSLRKWTQELARRQASEESLRQSQERYQLTDRAVNDGFWDWNILTNEDYFSPRWKDVIGYTDSEVANTKAAFLKLLHPDDLARVQEVTRAHLEEGQPYALEFRLRHKNGSYRWVFSRGQAMRDAAGRPVRMVGATTDITERKNAEKKLITLALRHQTLLQTGSDGIHVLDMQGNVVETNTAFATMLGYTTVEVMRLNVADWDAQLSRAELLAKIGQLMAHPGLFETRHRRKDGTLIEVEINGVGIELEGNKYFYACARDITARKQAEAALRASEAKFSAIINASPVPLALNDEQQHITFVNSAFVQTLGYDTADFATVADWSLKAYPDPAYRQTVMEAWQAELERAKRTGTAFTPQEARVHCKDGTSRTLLVSAASLGVSFAGSHLVVLYDITARKQAEAALLESEGKFRQMAATITDVFWMTSPDSKHIYYASPGFESIWGRPLASLYADAQVWSESILPEDRERVVSQFLALENGESSLDTEYRISRPDGSLRWIRDRGFQVRDAAGHIVRLTGLASDITEQKQAETALRESEARFRAIFNHNALATAIIEPDSNISMVNDAYCQVSGYAREEVVGRSWKRTVVSEDVERLTEYNRQRLINPHAVPAGYDFRFYRKNGEIRHAQISVALIQSSGQIVASMLDITERKLAAEALHHSTRMLQLVLENIPAFVFWKDRDLRYLGCNRNFAVSAGLDSPEAIIGKTDFDMVWPASAAAYQADDRKVMANNRPKLNFEEPQARADGSIRWLSTSKTALTNQAGEVFGVLGIYTDITEQKQAEMALRDSETRFRAMFEQAAVGMAEVGLDGRWLRVNRRLSELLGYAEAELLPMKFQDVTHPDDLAADLSQLQKLVAGDIPNYSLEKRYFRKDGRLVFANLTVGLVQDAAGEPKHFISVVEDITKRKQAETFAAMGREVLQILNEPGNLDFSIRRVVATLKTRSGFEAVGIRLQAGDDFPYFVQDGFPEDFLRTENSLVERSAAGGVCRDADGKVRLECTCGLVLSGQTDPANPLFTRGGSCWTNDSPTLLHVPVDADPRRHPRNQCIHHGYASVLLVPIRNHDRILGLIQFNDRRKNCFTLSLVELMEGIADQIGLALLRKQAEEALRKSQSLLTETEKMGHVGGWEIDLATQALTWSEAVHEIHEVDAGFQPTVEAGVNFYTPASRPIIAQAVSRAIEQGETFDVELEIITAKGNLRSVHAIGHADLARGKVFGFFQDITASKRAQAALQASEDRFAQLAVQSATFTWEVDVHGRYTFVSPVIETVLGYRAEEIVGRRHFYDLHPAAGREEFKVSALATFARQEVFKDFANPAEAKDGRLVWLSTNGLPVLNADGTLRGYQGADTDITERKQAESQLRDSEERYRRLFDLESDALFLLDAATRRFLDVNQSAQKLYGYSREEFLQLRAEDISAEPEKTRAMVGTGFVRLPLRWHRKKNGQVFPVEINANETELQGRRIELAAIRDITERQQVMAKLQETAAQLLEAQRIASLGSYVFNVPANTWTSSQVLDEVFGIAAASFKKDVAGWLQIIHPEERSAMQQYLQEEVLTGKADFNRTYRIIRVNDHQERWVHGLGKVTFDEQGKLVQMLGVIQDVTERKNAEEQIRRLTVFPELNPNPVLEFAADGTLTYQNAAALALSQSLGLSGMAELLPPEVDKLVRHCLTRHQSQLRVETTHHQRTFAASFYPIRETGSVHCYMGEITERKQAEEQMNLQLSALSAAANAIVITDHRGTIEWVNPSFTRLTGYAAEEVIGNNPRVLKSDQHPRAFYSTMWSTISTGNVWHGELVNKRKDGQLYHEDMTITPVRGAEGQITHFVAIKQDVTERRQLEIRLQQAQKMEAIGTLAGGIAHDFNNILSAIFGNGYLLQQDTEGLPEAQENVAEVLKAATRAKELVQQILTFSHQRELSRQSIRLETIIKEATKFLRASLPAEIRIDMQLAADAPAVLADPTQIYQVTLNLATNALHAMAGRPGRLTIALEAFQPDAPFLQAHPELQPLPHARLTVADTGQGMDARTLARIFEPFFTTKPVGQGTGLGLAVVHGIVQSHQGTITVASEVGRGTTFRLYFPAQTLAATVNEDAPRQLPHGLRQRILLLDDEPALTVTLQRLLERLQYHVTSFNSAAEALALFRKSPGAFDLVITDLTMPEINGLEVARTLHTLRPELPVILVSGFAPDATPDRLRAAGIGELLIKPVSLPALAEALQRALTTA